MPAATRTRARLLLYVARKTSLVPSWKLRNFFRPFLVLFGSFWLCELLSGPGQFFPSPCLGRLFCNSLGLFSFGCEFLNIFRFSATFAHLFLGGTIDYTYKVTNRSDERFLNRTSSLTLLWCNTYCSDELYSWKARVFCWKETLFTVWGSLKAGVSFAFGTSMVCENFRPVSEGVKGRCILFAGEQQNLFRLFVCFKLFSFCLPRASGCSLSRSTTDLIFADGPEIQNWKGSPHLLVH